MIISIVAATSFTRREDPSDRQAVTPTAPETLRIHVLPYPVVKELC
jgi:hypothetical protein